nr:MurR/RpiR family transcriptional regulator [Curvibacter sp. CHRR-16]
MAVHFGVFCPVSSAPPSSVDDLIQRIASDYNALSKQLKIIARYVEQHRDHIGLEGILDVARNCGVQPSAIVRFAKHFGFSGFSQLQAVFREGLSRQLVPGRNYQARIREVIESANKPLDAADIAREFISGCQAGMQELQQALDPVALDKAVTLLQQADSIWICGSRRSLPIAAYLDYALQHTDKRVGLISALGNMHLGQTRSVRAGDVLIAISFAPYANETVQVTELAHERGAHIIAITDSLMSPLSTHAHTTLVVQDHSTFGFRSLSSTMCLAQSLFIALAYRLELPYQPTTGKV